MRLQSRPLPVAAVDGDIAIVALRIMRADLRDHPHRQPRVLALEQSQARHQPVRGDGRQRLDREHAFSRLRDRSEGRAQAVERFHHRRCQAFAGFGRDDTPSLTLEQRQTEALLQQLDLVAHRGLRHAEFDGGAGEAAMARRRLEGADRTERRQADRQITHQLTLCIRREIRFVRRTDRRHPWGQVKSTPGAASCRPKSAEAMDISALHPRFRLYWRIGAASSAIAWSHSTTVSIRRG